MIAEILHKIAQQKNQEKENKYYPRPSLAGPERCIRQMVYWKLNFPIKPIPGRGIMIMEDSALQEDLTADWIRHSSLQIHSEQMRIVCGFEGFDFKLKGKIDGIVKDILEEEYLYEHKAINHFTWGFMAKGNPSENYLTQCAIYLRGIKIDVNINKGLLLIRNKNTDQFLEFLFEYDIENDILKIIQMVNSTEGMTPLKIDKTYPDIVKNAFLKFQAVENYANEKKIPKRQYERDSWNCDYCSYVDICWENYYEEFKQLATEVDLTEELETLCGYYLEADIHAKEMQKEADKLKEQIKNVLREKEVREGIVGKYLIRNLLIENNRIDKELIPPEILAICQRKAFSERLFIKLKKEVKEK